MKLKFKKIFIYVMCLVMLNINILSIYLVPLKVKAAAVAAPVAVGAYEAVVLLIELLGASAVAYGLYEITENPDALYDLAEAYFLKHNITVVGEEWGYDPTTGRGTLVGIPVILTPEQQKQLGVDAPFPDEEAYRKGLKKLYEDMHNGGGGGDNGGDNNNKKLPDKKSFTLANMDTDFVAKASAATVASVSSFWDKLFDGEIALEDDSALSRALFEQDSSYYGELKKIGEIYRVNVNASYNFSQGINYVSASNDSRLKPFCTVNNGMLTGYVADADCSIHPNGCPVKFIGTRTYVKDNGSTSNYDFSGGTIGSFGSILSYSVNAPVFTADSETAIKAYIDSGDDSGCINKEKRPPAMVDLKSANSKLPSTFSPLSSLPAGKAVNATALKNYVDDMVGTKDNINGDAETQAQTAKKKFEEHIQKNTVDVSDDTEEEEKPAPLPVFPDVDSSGTIGEGLTKDWRLVFPFCIPFDMVATVRSLNATPRAPCFEIPLDIELIDFSYTFVIDLSVFDDIARIFRLGETVLFLIGLMFVTGKVIKW